MTKDEKMTNDQIKHMVDRFLSWRLPENFNPDGGIGFEKFGNEGTIHEYRREPVGTNLFDAEQAEEMVRYMIEGLPSPTKDMPNPSDVRALVDEARERARRIRLVPDPSWKSVQDADLLDRLASELEAREVERLRKIIQWCRPRLKEEAYRATLDKNLQNPKYGLQGEEPRIIRSAPTPPPAGEGETK